MKPNPEEKQMEQKTEEEDTEVVVPEKEALEQETSDTTDQPAEEPEKPLLQARRSMTGIRAAMMPLPCSC